MNRVILLGVDGATFDLLGRWIEKGQLSTLRKAFSEGTHGNLKTTIPCLSVPAIPSLFTGMNPGKLGVFGFSKGDGSLVTYDDIEEESIWDMLADKGVKCCVVNLTGTYPPMIRNGVMISGGAPSERSDYVYPKELKSRVGGFYSDFDSIKELNPQENRAKIVELARTAERNRWRIFKDLMKDDNYGLGIFWIILSDDIQHYFWGLEDLLLEYYEEVDKILRDLIETFEGYNILIVSDHGFASKPTYDFHINSWLMDKGYLRLKGGRIRSWLALHTSDLLRHLWKSSPDRIKYFLLNLLPSVQEGNINKKLSNRRDFLIGLDWKNTVAYVDATSWGIRVDGRDQNLYERIRSKMIAELRDVKDIAGNPIVDGVWRREELFSGRYLEQVPDIVLLPGKNYSVNQFLSPRLIRQSDKNGNLRGDHANCRNGILIAYGPVFKRGHEVKDVSILDMAPTILHIMGCDIPERMDGKVMKEIFKEGSEPSRREIRIQKRGKKAEKKRELTPQETRQIEERLKALGYLG